MITAAVPQSLTIEPNHVYREQAKHYLGSHALADYRRCPWLYHKKQLGLIPDVDRPAYVTGRAAHTLILEGHEALDERFGFGGPINPKTGQPYGPTSKAFREWADAVGKPILTEDQLHLIDQMEDGVLSSNAPNRLLSLGVPEGVVRATYTDVPCQIRMDWFAPSEGIVDLKTCDDLTWFESDARRYGYVHQMAFYRAMLEVVTGHRYPVHIIAIEKREPFRCGVWRVGEDVLGIAQKENEAAIRRLSRSRAHGHWPTGYEDVRVFDSL